MYTKENENIQKLFAVHVLIKEIDFTEEENKELADIVNSMILFYKTKTNKSLHQITDNSIPLLTEENMKKFQILKKVRDVFLDGFMELAESYENNQYTREIIEMMMDSQTGRLPIMKTGEYKESHTHDGACAFAILYLDDVNNEKYGGQLKLYDPGGSNINGFKNKQIIPVDTKKNRLVIAPANVWHSVSQYSGKEDRLAIVFNLDYIPHLFSNFNLEK